MESNNANEPAFPSSNFLPGQDVLRAPPLGLTKREYFAGLAMQGELASYQGDTVRSEIPAEQLAVLAKGWVATTDALLAELESKNGK